MWITVKFSELWFIFCLGQPKSIKRHFPGHHIQSWRKFKDFLRTSTKILKLFKEKWNSTTFQGLLLKLKNFSRLCEPCGRRRNLIPESSEKTLSTTWESNSRPYEILFRCSGHWATGGSMGSRDRECERPSVQQMYQKA